MTSPGSISEQNKARRPALYLLLFSKSILRVAVSLLLVAASVQAGALVGKVTAEEAQGYRDIIFQKLLLNTHDQTGQTSEFRSESQIFEILPPADERGAVPERLKRQLESY